MCQLVRGETSPHNSPADIVFQDDSVLAYVSPKWWVNNPGHVLVIPKQHVENIYDISDELLAKVQQVGKQIAIAMRQSYGCEGISFRQHNEPAGNQAIWHYHLHVFPRWEGDNLYQNHNKTQWVTPAEKRLYVEKLVAALPQ